MIGINSTISTYVETLKRSNVPIQDLIPGDKLYEYKTNNLLEVRNVKKLPKNVIWEITYNDGRLSYVSSSDLLFTGSKICKTIPADDMCLVRNPIDNAPVLLDTIQQYPVKFQNRGFIDTLKPDPYIAGALLIHGDFDDEYINLPMDRESADNHFAHRYNLDFSQMKVGKRRCYYQYNGAPKSKAIKWVDFFKGHHIYATTKCREDPIISPCYTRASMTNRWKFIMGAFDIGYSKSIFPDTISISANDEYRLVLIQRMLCSMGVLSKVSYDGSINDKIGRCYRLDIVGSYDTFPGFFYDIEHINRILQNHNRKFNFEPKFELRIESIKRYTEGYMYNVELNKPHAIYIDSNFLPRISI